MPGDRACDLPLAAGFAGCGDFELGFVRTCCRTCGDELRVPFSCKSRAHDAVTALPDGRVRVSFKAPWRSPAAHADMDAQQFLARLCALAAVLTRQQDRRRTVARADEMHRGCA